MAGLLDLDGSMPQQGGLLGFLGAFAGAPANSSVNGSPPALDPYISALAGPQALQAARANYLRNVQAGMPAVARSGGSLADLMTAPGAAAGSQYSQEVAQAAKDAMMLREMRMMNALQSGQGAGSMGAGMAMLGGFTGSSPMVDAGKALMANDPRQQQALEAAKQALSIDIAKRDAAAQSGDMDTARMWHQKALTDSKILNIAERNNSMMYFPGGQLPNGMPNVQTINPTEGKVSSGGVEQPMTGAPATTAALSRAQASGPASFNIVPTVDEEGNEIPSTAARLAGGVPGSAAPASTAAPGAVSGATQPQPPRLALGPQQHEFLAGRGKESADYLGESQKAAEAARDTNYSLDQMLQAANGVTLGPGAPARMWLEKNFSAVGQTLGVEPSGELSNYQDLEKYANKIAFAATRQMGAREAAQIVELQMQSNPNKALNKEAFLDISNSMKAMNNYIIDKNAALQGSGKNAQAAAAQWTQRVDPRAWALTLSPAMGEKWAQVVGKESISQAYKFMTPQERAALISNIPPELRAKWLKPTS